MTGIPPGWESTTLGALGRYLNGRAFKKNEWSTRGRPIIRIQNLTGSGASYNYFEGDVEERYVARPGDLLVSWAATLGAYIWSGPEAVVNQHIFKVESNIDRRFHKYLIDYKLGDLMEHSHGSGMVHITRGRFDALPVAVPPLEEQQRIVTILDDHLSRLDAAEELMRTSQRRLNVMDRAVIDDVMVRRAEESGWPVVSLGELVGDKRTMTDGPFGSHLTSAHYSAAGAQVVRLQNIGDGQYKEAAAFIPLDHYSSLEKHNVVEGDVVVASLGDNLPRAAVVPDLGGPAIVKADCIRVRLPEQVEAQWVVLACRSSRAKHWARDRLHGVGRQRLGLGGIRDIPVPFPPSPAVRRSALEWMCDQLDNSILLRSDLDQELKRAEALRRSLLAAAFAGELTSGYEPEEGVA